MVEARRATCVELHFSFGLGTTSACSFHVAAEQIKKRGKANRPAVAGSSDSANEL